MKIVLHNYGIMMIINRKHAIINFYELREIVSQWKKNCALECVERHS